MHVSQEITEGGGGSNSKKYEFQILGVRSYFFVFFRIFSYFLPKFFYSRNNEISQRNGSINPLVFSVVSLYITLYDIREDK